MFYFYEILWNLLRFLAGGSYRATPYIPITDSEYWGLVSLSDENFVSLSRKGQEAELVQRFVDKIGYNRDIPVCVVTKEINRKDKNRLYADKRTISGEYKHFLGGNQNGGQKNNGNNVIIIYDSSKYIPPPQQRSARRVDASFFESHGPKYKIENDFFESYPPTSPIEYVTTKKGQTVVRCVLIRKTGDPYPSKVKPAHTFVAENIEVDGLVDEQEDEAVADRRPQQVKTKKSGQRKPLRTYVLVRPDGYDEFEDFSIQ